MVHGPGSLRMERSTGPGSLRTERSTGSGSLRTERSTDPEVFGRKGPRARKPSGGTVRRVGKSSDGMIRGEVSGVFFGTRCLDPASAHLVPLFVSAARPRHASAAHDNFPCIATRPNTPQHAPTRTAKDPARFQLKERRSRAGPPVCVRIWTPHPSTGALVSTGTESPRQPNFVVR
jgi:hypothetical protein